MSNLAGKAAVVTGGSRGIGAATTIRLADAGVRVAFTYLNSAEEAGKVVRQIESRGGRAVAIRADAADPAAQAAAIDSAAAEFGRLDILVNNAGILMGEELPKITLEQIDRILAVNVRAALIGAQAAAKYLRAGGRIINIGSIGARWFPQPMGTLYGMSKSALCGLTKGLARDLGEYGITVNLIEPGPIETDMLDADGADGPMDIPLLPLVALGRFGSPAEIASLVAHLSSEEAGFITGATITADGGLTL
ncbi:3-oxoacyl-[acyl-carrier protein] reductase [Amycolatopsis pretoriensis]|uniref:3-oxoacyl-[acyl-carrier protein] reductase n=1 Tax=Amycolatopsis pretoriensis TaxID=218821 RepID=A0A1H5QMW0_9PSEU|nr:SDR family oxidoreductase [Amycolatopsis pretoriensis]SEF26537.1 3-oxoacyl-[acyl-carrier protein] reductase [Amycolatopsis pretoriensis]